MPLLETPISVIGSPSSKAQVSPSLYRLDPSTSQGTCFGDWPNDAGLHTSSESQAKRQLAVVGKFPPYAAGRLFRTGPQAAKTGDLPVDHWFDGFTVLHRFDLVNNDATDEIEIYYAAKCQVDLLMEEARRTKQLAGITFAQKRDPCDSYLKKLKTTFTATRPRAYANVGVTLQRKPQNDSSGILTLTTDSELTQDFDPSTLEPMGVTKQRHLHADLKGPLSAAHAAFDPATGDICNYNIEFGAKAIYRIFRTNASTGATQIIATIADKTVPASYIHSMFITENFVILCVWPAYFTGMGISILWKKNLLDAMKFDESASCHWLVIDRRRGEGLVKRFTSPAMFAFHTTNAFEVHRSDGAVDIKCELVQRPNMDVLHKFYYENLLSSGAGAAQWDVRNKPQLRPSLVRYTLANVPVVQASSQKSRVAIEPAIVDFSLTACGELPTLNPDYATRPHRYVYGIADTGLSTLSDGIVKTDTMTGEAIYWRTMRHSPGEPIFIPRPTKDGEQQVEDDGVLLTVVLDGPRGTSYLLCLDAKDLSEIARADVQSAVGLGFHGAFIAEAT